MAKKSGKKKQTEGQLGFFSLIKNLTKTPRGRGILFFAGYFVFFIILFFVLRFGSRGEVIGTGYEKGKPYQFSIGQLLNQNYHFKHQILWDMQTFEYDGQRNQKQETFTRFDGSQTISYYRSQNEYLQQINGIWIKADNPYYFSEFFDENMISDILNQATYVSKTEYESGKTIYHFQISTATLVSLFSHDMIDIEDEPNDITVHVDSSLEVTELVFSLTSYCKYLGYCTDKLQIHSQYDDYGNIKEIVNPID